MYALADCNNFYVSCERAFNPRLIHKPVIVLSNNDGCVVARSNEAKQLGIAMGVPFFKIKSLCIKHCVEIYSSNYALYQDMSQRVMNTLELLCANIEIYSIDEAFLNLDHKKNAIGLCHGIRHQITQHTGIPVSIGIGPTKTLAKAASYIAKKLSNTYVFSLEHPKMQNYWLAQMPINEVWGIGKKLSQKLEKLKIKTALDFKLLNISTVRNQFSLPLEKIHRELNSLACRELDISPNKKSIVSSRSFDTPQSNKKILLESVSDHAARASEKLRKQNCLAKQIGVFIKTNPFDKKQAYYYNASSTVLPSATNNSCTIIHYAKKQLQQLYKEGKKYNKLGVTLLDFIPKHQVQSSMLKTTQAKIHQSHEIMDLLDKVNKTIGKKALFIAAQGIKQSWKTRACYHSKRYTTQWKELPLVK